MLACSVIYEPLSDLFRYFSVFRPPSPKTGHLVFFFFYLFPFWARKPEDFIPVNSISMLQNTKVVLYQVRLLGAQNTGVETKRCRSLPCSEPRQSGAELQRGAGRWARGVSRLLPFSVFHFISLYGFKERTERGFETLQVWKQKRQTHTQRRGRECSVERRSRSLAFFVYLFAFHGFTYPPL